MPFDAAALDALVDLLADLAAEDLLREQADAELMNNPEPVVCEP